MDMANKIQICITDWHPLAHFHSLSDMGWSFSNKCASVNKRTFYYFSGLDKQPVAYCVVEQGRIMIMGYVFSLMTSIF